MPDPGGSVLAGVDFAVRLVRAVTVTLLILSLVPVLFGWNSNVVLSGSMTPRLRSGDVVISQPVSAARLQPGQVVLVADPARPGTTLLHRLVRRDPAGNLITRGDANAVEDSTPVSPSMVRGLPRLRVPYIGLPVVWRHEGATLPLLLAALIGLAVLVLPATGIGAVSAAPKHRVILARAPTPPRRESAGLPAWRRIGIAAAKHQQLGGPPGKAVRHG